IYLRLKGSGIQFGYDLSTFDPSIEICSKPGDHTRSLASYLHSRDRLYCTGGAHTHSDIASLYGSSNVVACKRLLIPHSGNSRYSCNEQKKEQYCSFPPSQQIRYFSTHKRTPK